MAPSSFFWIPVLVLLAYAPVLCWLDIKYRDIFSHIIWVPAIVLNILFLPVFIMEYTWWTALLSIIGVFFWFCAMQLKIINGADFVYLVLISAFVIINPISGNLMHLSFMIFLIIWTALSMEWVAMDNLRKHFAKYGFGNRFIFSFDLFKTDRGLPFMVPISLALICAVVFG